MEGYQFLNKQSLSILTDTHWVRSDMAGEYCDDPSNWNIDSDIPVQLFESESFSVAPLVNQYNETYFEVDGDGCYPTNICHPQIGRLPTKPGQIQRRLFLIWA